MLKNKVLIISYYFPPLLSIATQRILGIANSFIDGDWDVTVLCSNPGFDRLDVTKLDKRLEKTIREGIKILRVGEPWYRSKKTVFGRGLAGRLIRGVLRYLEPYDSYGPWSRMAQKIALSEISKFQYHFIFVSAPPHSLLSLALRLEKKSNLPVALDFRDAWTSDPCIRFITPIHLMLARRLEANAINRASFLSVVQKNMLTKSNIPQDRCLVMPNGFVASLFPRVEKVCRNSNYTVSYMGTLYEGRDPEPVFRAVEKLKETNPDLTRLLKVEFWGWVYNANLKALSVKYGTESIVSWHEPVDYSSSLDKIVKSDALLLILPKSLNPDDNVLTGKIYEYLYSGNQILAFVPVSGAAAELIRKNDAGYIFDPQDSNSLAEFLLHELENFSQGNRIPIKYRPLPEYERSSICKSYVEKVASLF